MWSATKMPQELEKSSNDPTFYQKTSDFHNLLRLRGTSIEGHRTLAFGLSQIRGVGRRLARAIIEIARREDPEIDPRKRIGQLTEEQQKRLIEIIEDPVKNGIPNWMVNRQKDLRTGKHRHISGTDLEFMIKLDVDRMKRTRSWKGIRHMYGLKVRGQHTRTTGRQGLVVGFYRAKMKEKKK
jgi:ribosomal protein S13